MKSIGGFLGFEDPKGSRMEIYHSQPAFSTGRSCLYTILRAINPTLIYIPRYICESIFEPLNLLKLPYISYTIDDNFEIVDDLDLAPNEYLLYVNYFGLKGQYIVNLQKTLQKELIVDNSQAFFQKGFEGSWSFNSVRKFFGVPDGAYLYGLTDVLEPSEQAIYDTSYLFERVDGDKDLAFRKFRDHEELLSTMPMQMSDFTMNVLLHQEFGLIAKIRRKNYLYLDKRLSGINILDFTLGDDAVPLAYPLLLDRDLHKELIARKIFIPRYWPNLMVDDPLEWEYRFSRNLLPLPIDHRYNEIDMEYLVKVIRSIT